MENKKINPLESKILSDFLNKYGIYDIYKKEYEESKFEGDFSLSNMYTWIQVPINWKKSKLGMVYMNDLNKVWHSYLDENFDGKDKFYIEG
jgi:hypothetical protein